MSVWDNQYYEDEEGEEEENMDEQDIGTFSTTNRLTKLLNWDAGE